MKRNELWKSLVAKPPKMRFLVMLMCIFCTFNAVFANVSADKTVTIKSENISVKEALNMVKKQTGINIMYEDATLNNGDILLVAYLLYQTYRLMKDSGSINIFIGILVFIGIWLIVSQVLEMKLLGSIFDKLVSVGVLALIILFQDDIRRFLVTLGSHKQLGRFFRFLTGNKQAN